MKTSRPKGTSKTEKLREGLAFLLLLSIWIIPIYFYRQLSEAIPVHFSATGKVDGHGPRAMLFILPALYTLIYLLIGWLSRKPHIFNYPVTITEANSAFQYRNAVSLILWIRASVGIVLFVAVMVTIRTDLHPTANNGALLLPLSLLLLFVPVGYFLYRSFSGK